jgi:hypothetical protein
MDIIKEIRIEEVHDNEEGKCFYRVYIEINKIIKILGVSSTKPKLIRYISKIY